MPRQTSGEITGIESWIQTTGFPLEMRTAKKLHRCRFPNVLRGVEYTDSTQGSLREIDVLTHDVIVTPLGKKVGFSLVIECAYTMGKPWLVFQQQPQFGGLSDTLRTRLVTGAGFYMPDAIWERISPQGAARPSWYSDLFDFQDPVGYNAIQVPLKSTRQPDAAGGQKLTKDAAHDKMLQVLSAAEGQRVAGGSPENIEFVFPLIVIDGALYTCGLSKDSVRVRPTGGLATIIRLFSSQISVMNVALQIVTYSHLAKYAARFRRGLGTIGPNLDALIAKAHEIGNRQSYKRFI